MEDRAKWIGKNPALRRLRQAGEIDESGNIKSKRAFLVLCWAVVLAVLEETIEDYRRPRAKATLPAWLSLLFIIGAVTVGAQEAGWGGAILGGLLGIAFAVAVTLAEDRWVVREIRTALCGGVAASEDLTAIKNTGPQGSVAARNSGVILILGLFAPFRKNALLRHRLEGGLVWGVWTLAVCYYPLVTLGSSIFMISMIVLMDLSRQRPPEGLLLAGSSPESLELKKDLGSATGLRWASLLREFVPAGEARQLTFGILGVDPESFRHSAADGDWMSTVESLAGRAALIVFVRGGTTCNLELEEAMLREKGLLGKAIIVDSGAGSGGASGKSGLNFIDKPELFRQLTLLRRQPGPVASALVGRKG